MPKERMIWLYLARRDKKGIRLLVTMQGRDQHPVRVGDISTFGLPSNWQVDLEQMIHDSRFHWEPWIESASSYDELRGRLMKRGFSGVPINIQPEYTGANYVAVPRANLSSLPAKKTMVRRLRGRPSS